MISLIKCFAEVIAPPPPPSHSPIPTFYLQQFESSSYFVKGADLEILDSERHTAYDLAEELEIKSLVASGPNLTSLAIAKGDFDTLLRKIEGNEMTANTVFTSGLTALQVACQYEQLEVVDMLCRSGAVVNDQVFYH